MKAVVIGTGHGTRVQVPALRAAGFEVSVLIGRDRDKTERRADRLGIPRVCDTLGEALADEGIELVAIATPPESHRRLALEALSANRHVLCEKPLALSKSEAVELAEAARESGRVAVVGNEFRFRDSRAAVQSAIDAGRIGSPVFVDLVDMHSLLIDYGGALQDWFLDTETGGGWLGSSGSHAIDQALAWAGPVVSVSGSFHQAPSRRHGDSDDAFLAVLKFASGADGVIQESGAAYGGRFRVERVVGGLGTIRIDGERAVLCDAGGEEGLQPPALPFPGAEGDLDDPRDEFAHLRPFARLAYRLRQAIEGDDEGSPRLPTFEDGARTIAVMEALRTSAADNGRPVVP